MPESSVSTRYSVPLDSRLLPSVRGGRVSFGNEATKSHMDSSAFNPSVNATDVAIVDRYLPHETEVNRIEGISFYFLEEDKDARRSSWICEHESLPDTVQIFMNSSDSVWFATSDQLSLTENSIYEHMRHYVSYERLGSYSYSTRIERPTMPSDVDISIPLEQLVQDSAILTFTRGIEGVRPDPSTVDIATRVSAAAHEKTIEPEITVDVDGALSFDLRLSSGLLVLAELDLDGELDASVYDDREGILVKRLAQATYSQLIDLFLMGHRASS